MKACCETYLTSQFGDADLVAEIYAEYVKSFDEKLAEMKSLLAAQDWAALDHVVHTLKGNALSVGDNEAGEKAIALRAQVALADVAGITSLVDALEGLRGEL